MKQSKTAALDSSHSALDLFSEVRHLHPNLRFCGETPDALLTLPEKLIRYLLALLSGAPHPTPHVSPDEWSQLITTLKAHWVLPLLYWHAGHVSDMMRPPREVMDELRGSFQWSRIRTLYMDRQLQQLTAAFREAGVRMIVLKGPALARMVYPDSALRPGSDLDILVKPADMQQSRVLLEHLGYTCDARKFGRDVEALNHHEEYTSSKEGQQFRSIELHWKLIRVGILQENDVEILFDNAMQVSTDSSTFEALHPVDALIHRALNNAFMHDSDMRLIWIYDILMLARSLKDPEEWLLLQERSVAWRARLAIEVALTLARVWYGLLLPDGYADFSTWPAPSAEELDAWNRITCRLRRLDYMIGANLPHGATLLGRLWMTIRLIVPPRAVVVKSYPVPYTWLFPLSYMRRWGKWINELQS
jgi:Uncharacterised nucleotidyltransferase